MEWTRGSFDGHVTVGSGTRYLALVALVQNVTGRTPKTKLQCAEHVWKKKEEEVGPYIPPHCARKAKARKKTKSNRDGGNRYPVLPSMAAYMGLSTEGRMAAVRAVARELL
jgi:hypothetical protein